MTQFESPLNTESMGLKLLKMGIFVETAPKKSAKLFAIFAFYILVLMTRENRVKQCTESRSIKL